MVIAVVVNWLQGDSVSFAIVVFGVAAAFAVAAFAVPLFVVDLAEGLANFVVGFFNGAAWRGDEAPDRDANTSMKATFWGATILGAAAVLFLYLR